MPGVKLPVQGGLHTTGLGGRAPHLRSLQHCTSRPTSSLVAWDKQRVTRRKPTRSRCQATDGNGKPGMLWGFRNPFHGLGFGSQPAEAETSQPEPQEQPAAEAAQTTDQAIPWKAWNQYFDEMDECAQKMEDLDQSLVQATLLERFSEASRIKKEMDVINTSDVVETMLEEYSHAVESENYSKAAKLRDAGAAGLPGWWVAENKDDPRGHLLHIVPGFSRYVGYAFSPKDLARAEGLPIEDTLTIMQPNEDLQAVPLEEVGSPVIELFFKKDASGELQQQGTALSISPEVLSKLHSSLETELKLNPENITVQESKDIDGTPVIAITVSTMPEAESASVSGQAQDFSFPSSFVATPAGEETAGTSESLTDADLLDLQRLPAKITQVSRDELEVSLQPLSAEDQAEQERERRHDLVYDSRDHDSDDDEEEQASTSTTNIPGAISGMVTRQLHKLFPGQVISPAELEGLVSKDKQDAANNQPTGPSSTGTSHDGTLDVSIDEIASTSGRGSDAPVDDLPSWETAVGQVLQVVQLLKRVAPNPGPTPEDKQRHIDLMQKLDEAEDALTPKSKSPPGPTPASKSESTLQPQPPATPQAEPPKPDHTAKIEELYAALRSGQTDASSSQSPAELGSKKGSSGASVNELAGQVAGQVIQGAITQLNGSESSSQLMNHLTAAGDMEGKVMKYRRLDTDFVTTDPFTGLFLGAFGNQGPEVLQLRRQTDPDDDTVEWVIGTKLTGDSNVPAGEVSFRAKIGRTGRLGSADMYNPEMGVIARYKGSGRVAQTGFQNPTWVEGELLHLDGSGTRGAELGFVWNADKNSFLMAVLKRVNLNDRED